MQNRRNYYRILQVQPDAPAEVIKASYRTLMQRLRMHPDLGGDHWNAALVNEAYNILSDPKQRQDYDEQISQERDLFQRQQSAATGLQHELEALTCPFCHRLNLVAGSTVDLCQDCRSPLTPLPSDPKSSERTYGRLPKAGKLKFYTGWPDIPQMAELVNVSPTGLRIQTHGAYVVGQVIKIESPWLEGIAVVRNVKGASIVTLGLQLLTAKFHCDRGMFIHIKA
jgi:hypothetical protein